MKVYVLEFSYFDGCDWKNVTKEITALTMIQLMKAFIRETKCINEYIWSNKINHARAKTSKDVWNECKNYIEERDLTFPIVKTNY